MAAAATIRFLAGAAAGALATIVLQSYSSTSDGEEHSSNQARRKSRHRNKTLTPTRTKKTSKRTRTTTAASSKGNKKPRRSSRVRQQKYGPFWNGTTSDSEIITVLVNRRDFAFHYDARTSRLNLVQEVWEHEIIPYLNVKELAVLRPTCKWCNKQWHEFLKKKHISCS